MANPPKHANWDKIRGDYVLNPNYPTFDELAKKYGVSKPVLIAKASDLDDPINNGLTWVQQRQRHVQRKQDAVEDVAVREARSAIRKSVKVLHNILMKSFVIVDRELNQIDAEQRAAIAKNKPVSKSKYVKLNDLTRMMDILNKLSETNTSKEMTIKLQMQDNAKRTLEDLDDDELAMLEREVMGVIVDESVK